MCVVKSPKIWSSLFSLASMFSRQWFSYALPKSKYRKTSYQLVHGFMWLTVVNTPHSKCWEFALYGCKFFSKIEIKIVFTPCLYLTVSSIHTIINERTYGVQGCFVQCCTSIHENLSVGTCIKFGCVMTHIDTLCSKVYGLIGKLVGGMVVLESLECAHSMPCNQLVFTMTWYRNYKMKVDFHVWWILIEYFGYFFSCLV